jgi:rubrerythrin
MSFLSKLINRDALSGLQDVIANLGLLADAEEQISEFYRLCANAMPEEADFWGFLADQEIQHAENARKMLERIALNPQAFKPGMSFSTVKIRMFVFEIQRLVERMRGTGIPTAELFAIALEIENSAVEANYGLIVKTEDGIFNMLARRNDKESLEHKSSVISRMNAAEGQEASSGA